MNITKLMFMFPGGGGGGGVDMGLFPFPGEMFCLPLCGFGVFTIGNSRMSWFVLLPCHWGRAVWVPGGVVPQSDVSSTIIVSRCYNDLNFFL